MVKPEDRIKGRIWDVAHMTTLAANEQMNGVMHVLYTIVPPPASIGIRCV